MIDWGLVIKELEKAVSDYNDILDSFVIVNTNHKYWTIWDNDWESEYYDYDLDQDFRWRCRIQ